MPNLTLRDQSLVPPSFPRSRVGMHTELSKPLTEMAGQGSHAGAWEPAVIYPSFPRSRVGMHTGLSKPLTEMAGQGSHAGAWEPALPRPVALVPMLLRGNVI